MAFIDVFNKENQRRYITGVVRSDAIKLLMITFLINRVDEISINHKLMGLYDKYNSGPKDFTYIGYD